MKLNRARITDEEIIAANRLFADWPAVRGGKAENMNETRKPRTQPQGTPMTPEREAALSDWLDSLGVPPVINRADSGMEYIEIPSFEDPRHDDVVFEDENISVPPMPHETVTAKPESIETAKTAHSNGYAIPDGTYTVVYGNSDDYRTLRFETQGPRERFMPNETIISFLSGPDNEASYTSFGIYKQVGGKIISWKKFRGGKLEAEITEAVKIIRKDPEAAGLAYAMKSGRCRRCGRKLTVPASLHRGFGPDCAAKVGI